MSAPALDRAIRTMNAWQAAEYESGATLRVDPTPDRTEWTASIVDTKTGAVLLDGEGEFFMSAQGENPALAIGRLARLAAERAHTFAV